MHTYVYVQPRSVPLIYQILANDSHYLQAIGVRVLYEYRTTYDNWALIYLKNIYINTQAHASILSEIAQTLPTYTASSLWLGYSTELTVGVKYLPLAGWDQRLARLVDHVFYR